MRWFGVLFLLVAAWPAAVSAELVVDSLVMPAWLEREGARLPLRPGIALAPGDRLRTGRDGALTLSYVRRGGFHLGEGALVRVMENGDGQEGAWLGVIRGNYRYRAPLAGAQFRIDGLALQLVVGRGEVVGEVNADHSLAVTLGGTARVEYGASGSHELNGRGSAIRMEGIRPPSGVEWVEEEEMARLLARTEAPAGGVERDGPWKLVVASFRDEASTAASLRRLNGEGYAAISRQVKVKGEPWWRVMIEGFAEQKDAQACGRRLRERFHLDGTWSHL